MAKRRAILAGVLAAGALCGTALAQAAPPITSSEAAGDWMLKITPAERQASASPLSPRAETSWISH